MRTLSLKIIFHINFIMREGYLLFISILLITCKGSLKNENININKKGIIDTANLDFCSQINLYGEKCLEFSNDTSLYLYIYISVPTYIDTSFILSINKYTGGYILSLKKLQRGGLAFNYTADSSIKEYFVKSKLLQKVELDRIINILSESNITNINSDSNKSNSKTDGCFIQLFYTKGEDKITVEGEVAKYIALKPILIYLLEIIGSQNLSIPISICS